MSFQLLDFFPLSSNTLLVSISSKIRVLNLCSFFFRELIHAINELKLNKFESFDAQVSENLCQVRAYMLCDYYHTNKGGLCYSSLIEITRKKLIDCDYLISMYEYSANNRSPHNQKHVNASIEVSEFIGEHGLNIEVTALVFLIAQLYILSKYKVTGDYFISKGVNYAELGASCQIKSKTYIRKVVHKLQKNVSYLSCEYVFGLIQKNDKKRSFLFDLLRNKDEVGRELLACYETTKALLDETIHFQRLVKVKVFRLGADRNDQIDFFLEAKQGSKCYKLCNQKSAASKPGLVFIGVCQYRGEICEDKSEYMSRFVEQGFSDIILSNMAQHPQFSGSLLKEEKENPYVNAFKVSDMLPGGGDYIKLREEEFLWHKKLSGIIGCSLIDRGLFLLSHIMFAMEEKELGCEAAELLTEAAGG